jgi:hypothetical protein
MHEEDIQRAIYHKTLLLIAGIENREALYQAVQERLAAIGGMIELAQHQEASESFLRFLRAEQAYLSRKIEAVM